ncbi:MAG: hypothetical protein ACKOEO_14880 [Planctomycetaceae bacterium]
MKTHQSEPTAATTAVESAVAAEQRPELLLPIHFAELRRTWLVASIASAFAGGVFGLAGAIFDLNGVFGALWGWSLAITAVGVLLYLLFLLFFSTLFAATFFIVSLVLLLPGLLMLQGISRLRPVTAVAERWLLILSATLCCGAAGVVAVGLWLPLKPEFLFGGVLSAAAAAVMVFRKVVPRGLSTAVKPAAVTPQTYGRSVWEDLE